MKTNILGFPRIGENRELKKATENFWNGKINQDCLYKTAKEIKISNWIFLKNAGIDFIPSNDFSFYDQILDMCLTVGAIPERYNSLKCNILELYFAMAHGYQKNGIDLIAMEMTKWFDTNYHYIVPEFYINQKFSLFFNKPLNDFLEAKQNEIITKPVLIGPISFLLLGKVKGDSFNRINLIDDLLNVYFEIFKSLENHGCEYIQIDEPFLCTNLDDDIKELYLNVFKKIKQNTKLNIILTTYFDGLNENTELAYKLNTYAIHIDLVRAPQQLDLLLASISPNSILSLGIVDGRNIWKNDFNKSLNIIKKVKEKIGDNRIIISSSCSLLHVPINLDNEHNTNVLTHEIKRWLAFAKQKVEEIVTLNNLVGDNKNKISIEKLAKNNEDCENRKISKLIHNQDVINRVNNVSPKGYKRTSEYCQRAKIQKKELNLPLFPTTTIGSFPQTKDIREIRLKFKKNEISTEEYNILIKNEIRNVIEFQEQIGIDVLVHGEFERNDMVEYFGEQLDGFTFTQNGWVQSYGSRCVKPPIIYGDVSRSKPMTIDWIKYAQSLTKKYVKGMLTGPVTILQWTFVRNDQPREITCKQIALAIRDEVTDLEKAGIKIIQIDEPAIREGLPIRNEYKNEYLKWAVDCFKLASSSVKDKTQIHTHMCYSEFNDIIENIAKMDADVITIECSRSQMELLDAFGKFKYPNEIGPGVYDIHSPRVPSVDEIENLIFKASKVLDINKIWINPDCGLKTRGWSETELSLKNMVEATKKLRKKFDIK
ncbi:MAG: 5-methyltetrahydropteroyltriglutamate--homocysteine S-methyltransferase [Bacteroidales bacterium]|nr:5-methyltetrahydropteroyltriglutamate--homocysteine S-methyltransferase [Bacteroidales bacterium]